MEGGTAVAARAGVGVAGVGAGRVGELPELVVDRGSTTVPQAVWAAVRGIARFRQNNQPPPAIRRRAAPAPRVATGN